MITLGVDATDASAFASTDQRSPVRRSTLFDKRENSSMPWAALRSSQRNDDSVYQITSSHSASLPCGNDASILNHDDANLQ